MSKIMLTFATIAVMREFSNFILLCPDQKSGHCFALLMLFCCYPTKSEPPTRYQSAVWAAQSCLTLKNHEYITSG